MNILVTNDDGVYAPGLRTLAQTLMELGNVKVIAPDRNCSGASSALTLDKPLRIQDIGNNYISVQGTPTDCVHIGVSILENENRPDVVVSGINAGSNLGDDVFYSGTVAAAMEGRFMGIPAIALSLVGKELKHYATAAAIAKQIVMRLHSNPLPRDTILNINVPDLPIKEIQGFEVTRLGTRHCAEPVIRQIDPRGAPIYWIGLPGIEEDAGAGTDFYAVNSNRVSITPIRLDMTNYSNFEQVATLIKDIEIK